MDEEFEDILVCDRMGVSPLELDNIPERIITKYRILMSAEAAALKEQRRGT